ncbi:MAG: tetratricopeptide repeat protein, partial [Bacteroidales bacterium]|nr:tetratricopeptide repeat protein [Bacteroidales bacterium]
MGAKKAWPFLILPLIMLSFNYDSLPSDKKLAVINSFDRFAVKNLRSDLDNFLDALRAKDFRLSEQYYLYFDSLISREMISDTLELSEAIFYCGYQQYLQNNFETAYQYFFKSSQYRSSVGVFDAIYRNALLNSGSALFRMGRFYEAIKVYDQSIVFIETQDGPFSPDNVSNFNNLASSLNEIKDYERAIDAAKTGLEIADSIRREEDAEDIIRLYNNLGISYSRQNDYSQALLYQNQAYSRIEKESDPNISLYLNIINSLAISNTKLGNRELAGSYYRKALPVALSNSEESSFLILSNYAVFLAGEGKKEEAGRLLSDGIAKLSAHYDNQTRFLYEMLDRQAGILSQFDIDNNKALSIIEGTLIPFCRQNRDDHVLVRDAYHTYAMALRKAGRYNDALGAIQNSLFAGKGDTLSEPFINPDFELLIPDRTILSILSNKVFILRDIFMAGTDTAYLGHAIETNRLLISYLETVRIDISEEESRIILGDNFRKLYDAIIADLNTMFSISGDRKHFVQAFEYAERGKAAGLLVSMREIQARQFLIPDSLSAKEKLIERELGVIREMIVKEMSVDEPDTATIASLKDDEYRKVLERTALTELFENNYPEYFTAKYNTSVAGIEEILKKIRKRSTYINY